MRKAILMSALVLVSVSCAARTEGADTTSYSSSRICSAVSIAKERAECETLATEVEKQWRSERAGVGSIVSSGAPIAVLFLSWGWTIIYYGIGIVIGRFVYRDAKQRPWLVLGLGPRWWGAITIIQPAMGLLCYWVMHYSGIARTFQEANDPLKHDAP